MGYDLSDIEHALAKENDLLLLGVNAGETYIPLRVAARVEVPYLYDPIAEQQLGGPLATSPSTNGVSNNTFQAALQLGSPFATGKPTDVFDLTRFPSYVYQVFVGIAPSALRVFLQQPFRTDQRTLPVLGFTPAYAQSGYFDGLLSPLYRPSRKTQMWILPGLSIALGYENIEPQPAFPLLFFYINALNVQVVTDPGTAYEMINDPKKARISTVAGLQGVSYNVASHYGIPGIALGDTLAEVAVGVTPEGTSPLGLVTRQQ